MDLVKSCGFFEWLVGGWTNPSEKYALQIGSFPQWSELKKMETTETSTYIDYFVYVFVVVCCFHVLLEAAITALNICQHNFSCSGLLWGSQAWHNAVTYNIQWIYTSEVCRSNLREWNFEVKVTRLTSFQTRGWKRYRHKSHGFKSEALPHLQSCKLLYR